MEGIIAAVERIQLGSRADIILMQGGALGCFRIRGQDWLAGGCMQF